MRPDHRIRFHNGPVAEELIRSILVLQPLLRSENHHETFCDKFSYGTIDALYV